MRNHWVLDIYQKRTVRVEDVMTISLLKVIEVSSREKYLNNYIRFDMLYMSIIYFYQLSDPFKNTYMDFSRASEICLF